MHDKEIEQSLGDPYGDKMHSTSSINILAHAFLTIFVLNRVTA